MAAPLPESDGDLVRLALEGRQDAFSALYERYFPSVFDFVTRLLRNREEAADVAQDAFIKAMEQLPTLKNPDRFKSWIFTIAHRTGLNRIRSSKRTATVGGSVDDDERATMAVADADPSVDPEQMAAIQEAADIIWEAAAGLDARTYAVMDLHVRHGLDSAEIAEVMGVSKGNAYTMVSRMKQSFSKTLSTYLLVRKGRADCSTLASVIGPDTEQMTPDLRKRADRHVNRCDVCSDNRLFYMEPLKMFAALMLVPVPAGLKAAIWGSVAASAAGAAGVGTVVASGSGAGAAAGGGAGTSGAGAAAGGVAAGAQAGTIAAAVAAVALTVAVAAGAFALFNRTDDPPPAAAPFPTTTTTTVIVEPVTPATPPPTTTITATPPPTTTVAPVGEPPPPPPTPTTLPPPPPPPDFDVANDTGTLAEDTTIAINVLANDVGPIDAASLRVVSGPTNGSAATNADGAILYTPAANFVGADQISYSVADTLGRSAAATVSLAVTPINDNPVVPGPGSVVTAEDITISFDPLDGASDVDGDVLTMTSFDTTSAAGGSLAEGSLVYTPPPNFFGTDSFTYTVSDGTVDVLVSVQ
ncbi:MAG TPA: sigma-70 family RNA polymerase sigma factor, partial [Acidimicrobiia bacterium]|nr:sigma-70 family RNA polymerase sigma factor [Acidimicrobiia bacterium]